MALTVTHAKNVTIADDPVAKNKGEVLPSDWNANHSIAGSIDASQGGRTKLTVNTNYYVSATGSDSNGGTNSSTDAWLTLQHAMDFIAGNLDCAGFQVTVNIGAGSFTGFGARPVANIIQLLFKGAGSASTTITAGPNDGSINLGDCVSINSPISGIFAFDQVKFKVPAGASGIGNYISFADLAIGDQIAFAGQDIAFDLSVSNSSSNLINTGANSVFNTAPGTVAVSAGTAGAAWLVGGGLAQNFSTWTLTGTPAISIFANISNGFYFELGTYSGAATGKRFQATDRALMTRSGGNLGLTWFPGNVAGTVDASSYYDALPFIQPVAGDPTTSQISDSGAWQMVENTNLGITAPFWNNAGSIRQIGRYRLTADTNFYVSATGSDSHGGTNSSTDAWLTLQHAINYVIANLDLSGHAAIINVGAGSFAGFTAGGSTNGGSIYVIGAGSASTTITSGAGNAILYNGLDAYFGVDAVTFDVNNSGSNGAIFINAAIIGGFQIGNINFNNVDVKFTNSGASSLANCITIGAGGGLLQPVPGGAMTIAANFNAVIFMSAPGAFLLNNTTITASGNPTWGQAFLVIIGPGLYQEAGAVSGAASGTRFILTDGGGAFGGSPTQGALGPTHFSGSVAGTADGDSNYDGFVGPLPGIDTQTGASYTLALSDYAEIVEMNNAGANTVTVPSSSTVNFPVGTKIWVTQTGAGATATSSSTASGVILHNFGAVGGQWKSIKLYKRGADEWVQTNA